MKRKTINDLQTLPDIKKDQIITQVKDLRGNSTFEVCTSDSKLFLVNLPTKFKNLVFVKRG